MAHYNKDDWSFKDANRNVVMGLNLKFFDKAFLCPSIDSYVDITMEYAQEEYEKDTETYNKKVINSNWLKNPRPSVSRWPKSFPRNEFIEEVNDLVTFLSRVKVFPTSSTFQD